MKKPIAVPVVLLALLASTAAAPAQTLVTSGPRQLEVDPSVVVDLHYSEPVPISTIAKDLGTQLGIKILLEPNLRDRDLTVDLRGLSPDAALQVLGSAARVFFKTLAPDSLLVAADTPQNRRDYEEIGIQVFYLRHASVPSVMTSLRSILGTKAMAAQESHHAIVVRDNEAKLALARLLIEGLDVNPGAAEVAASFYEVDRQALEHWLKTEGSGSGAGLTGEAVEGLVRRADGVLLAAPTIGVRGGRGGRFRTAPATNEEPSTASPTLRLALELVPGHDPERVVLAVEATTAAADLESEVELSRSGGYHLVRPGAQVGAGGKREIVLFMSLRSFEPPTFAEAVPDTWWVGSESTVRTPVDDTPQSQPRPGLRLRPLER